MYIHKCCLMDMFNLLSPPAPAVSGCTLGVKGAQFVDTKSEQNLESSPPNHEYLAVSGKLGLPQVTRLSILSHDLMTWMIWGYPYDLENLHFSFHQTTALGFALRNNWDSTRRPAERSSYRILEELENNDLHTQNVRV